MAEEWDVFAMPADDSPPTLLATLYEAYGKSIRVELNGAGTGQFTVNKDATEATAEILAQGNLVKVRFPEIDDDYLFAFFIETGDFTLISSQEEGGEALTFGGRGALMYTEYAQAWSESYIDGGQDPVDGVWRAYAAGTGNKPGQILRRMIEEMQDPDRPQQPLPLLTIDFDYDDDSDGETWEDSTATDEFSYQVGEKGLAIIERLIQTEAITIQMGPDFDLHAYNSYGEDKTATVHFERGVNIANELLRQLEASRGVTHMLVGGELDRFGYAVGSSAGIKPVKEGFVTNFGTGTTALDGIGAMELETLEKRTDRVTFQIANRRTAGVVLTNPVSVGSPVGPVAADGFYLPGPTGTNGDFWLGDTVLLTTGTSPFDFTGARARVMAITIARDDANAELNVFPEVEIQPLRLVLHACNTVIENSIRDAISGWVDAGIGDLRGTTWAYVARNTGHNTIAITSPRDPATTPTDALFTWRLAVGGPGTGTPEGSSIGTPSVENILVNLSPLPGSQGSVPPFTAVPDQTGIVTVPLILNPPGAANLFGFTVTADYAPGAGNGVNECYEIELEQVA